MGSEILSSTILLAEEISQKDIESYLDFLGKIGNKVVDTYSILEMSITLALVFLVRTLIWFLIKRQSIKAYNIENKKINKFLFFQVFEACGIEFVLSYILSFLFIIIGNIPHTQYLMCTIFIPALTFLAAVFLDVKFFLPLLQKNSKEEELLKFLTDEKNKENAKKDKKENKNKSKKSNKDLLEKEDANEERTITIMDKEGLLTDEVAESDDFKEIIVDFINSMKKESSEQSKKIENIGQQIDSITTILNVIRESEMINKKIELKKLIYECLNEGYATPEENDKITSYYHSYTALNGNGEVKDLYENHYLKLPIHDNKRQSLKDDVIDRRGMYSNSNESYRKYSYGELDKRN